MSLSGPLDIDSPGSALGFQSGGSISPKGGLWRQHDEEEMVGR